MTNTPTHKVTVRLESRKGMRQVEYRATCLCGWTEKAMDEGSALHRGATHIGGSK